MTRVIKTKYDAMLILVDACFKLYEDWVAGVVTDHGDALVRVGFAEALRKIDNKRFEDAFKSGLRRYQNSIRGG